MINIAALAMELRPLDPEKIILFGSYAKGKVTKDSDVDLLIIQRTKKRPVDRVAEALKLVWGSIPHVEPYILTPEEFSQSIAENRSFVTREILKYGKTIYEKKS